MTVKTVTFDSKAQAIKAYTDMFLVAPNKTQIGLFNGKYGYTYIVF